MFIVPTRFDLWLAAHLAHLYRLHHELQIVVDSGIHHTVFGGLWYGAALFVCWAYALRSGRGEIRVRLWTILAAMAIAVAMTFVAGALFKWPPPVHYPGISGIYLPHMRGNPNTNSFPSQSTAVYACVAAGIYSVHRLSGWILWVLLPIAIALPRMMVGGHYFSDIVAGLAVATAGYWVTRYGLERRVITKLDSIIESHRLLQFVGQLVAFTWIVQVTVEFRDAAWVARVVGMILR